MSRIAALIFFVFAASPALCDQRSAELKLGLAAEDRGDLIEAKAHYLSVIEIGLEEGPSRIDSEAAYRLYGLSVNLSLSRETGFGFEQGVVFLEAAAAQGYPAAQYFLGYLISQTYKDNPNKNLVRAFSGRLNLQDANKLMKAAADAGHYGAFMELAEHYRDGSFGALQDPSYADELERQGIALATFAVAAGDPEAADNLAYYIRTGRGDKREGSEEAEKASREMDYTATKLFEESAKAGSVSAMRTLMYRYTDEEKNDLSETEARARAEYWAKNYLQGASNFAAVTWVARLYQDSKIGQRPAVAAHALLNFASTLTDSSEYAAKTRDELGAAMTKVELDEARKLARMCVEDGMTACLGSFP